MLHANGTSYHPGRTTDPATATRATRQQRNRAHFYATASLRDLSTEALTKALELLTAHPDANAAGYSTAKSARQRVVAELAQRL